MGSLALNQRSGFSLGALGRRKLRSLAAALDLSEDLAAKAFEVFALMSGEWADWAVGDSPPWPNDISDDGTPFEFSASFDGGAPRLRMLVESQSEPISRTSSWAAGLALGERLEVAGLADLTMFERIRDLFLPHGAQSTRFSLWHAAVIQQGAAPLFKAYMNPCVLGAQSAPYVVEQALHRLGLGGAWDFLKGRLAASPTTEIRYFSVDLADPAQARVKVYLGSSQSAEDVDRLIAPARNSEPQDAERWLATLTASQGPFTARPILSCFSFHRGSAAPDVTVHVPIRCHVKHDAEALARVSHFLTKSDAEHLSRALLAVSERPLNVGRGLLTYASLRREAGAVRVTVYLAAEAYAISSRRPTAPPPKDLSSGVHKASAVSLPLAPTHSGTDALELISRQLTLFSLQPVFGHLASPGTAAQAEGISSCLAALQLFSVDLLCFAHEHAIDLRLGECFAELAEDGRAWARRFQATTEKLTIDGASHVSMSPAHDVLREVAYARVADVISAKDDSLRLLVVMVVSSVSELLLKKGLQFVTDSMPGGAPAASDEDDRPSLLLRSEVSSLDFPDSVDIETTINRSFESMFRVATAIDRAAFGA